jgi:hypothetical protein
VSTCVDFDAFGASSAGRDAQYYVCEYDTGNVLGQFAADVEVRSLSLSHSSIIRRRICTDSSHLCVVIRSGVDLHQLLKFCRHSYLYSPSLLLDLALYHSLSRPDLLSSAAQPARLFSSFPSFLPFFSDASSPVLSYLSSFPCRTFICVCDEFAVLHRANVAATSKPAFPAY